MAEKRKVTLSFSGCGFLGIYHVGVASAFREFEDHFEVAKVTGASAGAIAAATYLCRVCLGEATADVLNIARAARASPIGPLSPRFNIVKIIRNGLMRVLPENAHLICTGRLSISLTRCHDGKNLMVSEFASKEDLVQVLICSSFVPFYSGVIPPFYKDARYWDGGISNNLPICDDGTITISPFSGESDICPADSSATLFEMNFANHSLRVNSRNVYRVSRALFPPHPEALSEICKEGYVDAHRYIKKILLGIPDIIPTDHPLMQQFAAKEEKDDDSVMKTEMSLLSTDKHVPVLRISPAHNVTLPSLVVDAFREACRHTPHPAMQALSVVTLPWVFPLELMYTTCVRLMEMTPRPRTMELEYYVEIFSSLAQKVAVKLLNRHQTKSWLKCCCSLESVKMSVSGGARCMIHSSGTAKFPHSHAVTFAFAMSIEESADPTFSMSSLDNTTKSLGDCGEGKNLTEIEEIPRPVHVITEQHSGQIKLLMAENMNYEEVVAIMSQHEEEIVEYFQNLILAGQPPLIIPANDVLALDMAASGTRGPIIMEIEDLTADSEI